MIKRKKIPLQKKKLRNKVSINIDSTASIELLLIEMSFSFKSIQKSVFTVDFSE